MIMIMKNFFILKKKKRKKLQKNTKNKLLVHKIVNNQKKICNKLTNYWKMILNY